MEGFRRVNMSGHRFTSVEAAKILETKGAAFRQWLARALIAPTWPGGGRGHTNYFSFSDLVRIKIFIELNQQGKVDLRNASDIAFAGHPGWRPKQPFDLLPDDERRNALNLLFKSVPSGEEVIGNAIQAADNGVRPCMVCVTQSMMGAEGFFIVGPTNGKDMALKDFTAFENMANQSIILSVHNIVDAVKARIEELIE